jgi:hypothetical protein
MIKYRPLQSISLFSNGYKDCSKLVTEQQIVKNNKKKTKPLHDKTCNQINQLLIFLYLIITPK